MFNLKFDEKGLIPAIVQDINTKKVLMLAYMNQESLDKTIETKQTWFFSRSRNELWNKGATSGHIQHVKKVSYDCDEDAVLVEVEQVGSACHTGEYSCFYRTFLDESDNEKTESMLGDLLGSLVDTIEDRKINPKEKSYTNYLFDKGIDKVLKKVGEEAAEVIIASKNPDKSELIYELCDLIYHSLVLMNIRNISLDELEKELRSRYK